MTLRVLLSVAPALLLLALPACSSPDAFHQRWCGETPASGTDIAACAASDIGATFVLPLPQYSGGEGWGDLAKTAPSPPAPLPRSTGGEGGSTSLSAFPDSTWTNAKPVLPDAPLTCLDRVDHVGAATCDLFKSLIYDFKNFYLDGTNLALLAGGVAVAAPLANTHADRGVRDWYQNSVRSPNTDHWSANAKIFGTYQTVIPIYLGAIWGGALFPDTTTGVVIEDWASRTLRGMAVGAPAVGLGQIGLGSGRPGMGESSHWSPGNGVHGVAGHAFVGAMPFLTAAAMVDSPWLKAPLIAASFATGWSRINDDDHYLSQVILGWWIAWLSVRSVNQTERQRPHLHFVPCTAGGPGVGIMLTH